MKQFLTSAGSAIGSILMVCLMLLFTGALHPSPPTGPELDPDDITGKALPLVHVLASRYKPAGGTGYPEAGVALQNASGYTITGLTWKLTGANKISIEALSYMFAMAPKSIENVKVHFDEGPLPSAPVCFELVKINGHL